MGQNLGFFQIKICKKFGSLGQNVQILGQNFNKSQL